jgi:hypothetical protein
MINRLSHLARTPKDEDGKPISKALDHFEAGKDTVQIDFEDKFFDVDVVTNVFKKYGVSAKDLAHHMNVTFSKKYAV